MPRISALHLALVRLVGRRRGFAPRRRDLPSLRALVEEVRAALRQADVRAGDLHAAHRGRAALRQLQSEDRLLAGLLLLLLHLRRGLLAERVAGGLAVAALERRMECLGHGRGIALALTGPAGGER